MKKHFIGVDPSLTNSGIVILDSKGQVVTMTESKRFAPMKLWNRLPSEEKKTCANQMHRLTHIKNCIQSVVDLTKDIYVGYEDYSYNSENRSFSLGELGGILKEYLISISSGIILLSPPELKKFATGHGSSGKKKVQAQAIMEETLMVGQSDDIADAYFLAKAAWFAYAGEEVIANDTIINGRRLRFDIVNKGRH